MTGTIDVAQPALGGPLAEALEKDLRSEVVRHGVVVLLDTYSLYTEFVDRLARERDAGRLPYAVFRFRGSFLELLHALGGVAGGVERPPLVVHVPGHNTESIRRTPLLELYEAGRCFQRSLTSLVDHAARGRVGREEVEAFTLRCPPAFDEAEAWLTAAIARSAAAGDGEVGRRPPTELLEDLYAARATTVGRRGVSAAELEPVWRGLTSWLGIPATWRTLVLPGGAGTPDDLAHAAASWALCVEYVHDLKRAPVSALLSAAKTLDRIPIAFCRAVCERLRDKHPEHYRRAAEDTEAMLADEVAAARAEDLGEVDTFRFEEEKVLDAALAALARGEHQAAASWARARMEDSVEPTSRSFWLRHDLPRRSTWMLVHAAARLGLALAAAGTKLAGAHTRAQPHEAAAEVYARHGVPVDRAHRVLEQLRVAHLFPGVPRFEALRARLDELRQAWREWADTWARQFNALCRAHGFLPPPALQQRSLFDDVVRQFAKEPGTTALFVVDALRFEMGAELHELLRDLPATNVHLKARFAELPTVTEVGMNVLAPVMAAGKLRPVLSSDGTGFLGFQTGEYRVDGTETRKRAMQARVGGGTCPWYSLAEVVERDATSLTRALARAQLVIVHSREIDEAGESGVGPSVFDTVLRRLEAAWRRLREAGVRSFVITSDHGFLLLDGTLGGALTHGRRSDPKRRHVFSQHAADHAGEVRVSFAELGYEGVEGQVMFPESAAVFDTGERGTGFVHGGNSLQERLIPVLTIVHREAPGARDLGYAVTAEALEGTAGLHRILVRVAVVGPLPLDFGALSELDLGLRVVDAPGVRVELCQASGRARVEGSAVAAPVGDTFELYFRLAGSTDSKVAVEVVALGGHVGVEPARIATRFPVTVGGPRVESAAPPRREVVEVWLAALPEGGVRQVFQHLADHGAVTEIEAAAMLGGPRALRRFALELEQHVRCVPFGVRIDVVGGVKRYVKEAGR